jgi:ATP-dependent DNA helicase RecG
MQLTSNGVNPDSPLADHVRILEPQKRALNKLGIATIRDFLYHFPARYGDTSEMKTIESLSVGDSAVIFGKISKLKTSKAFHKRIPMSDGVITDETGSIKVVWFHQPYIAKMIGDGAFVRTEGKVSERRGELYLSNPKIETISKMPLSTGSSIFGGSLESHTLYPVYPESRGITSNWIYHAIQKLFNAGALDSLTDSIPEEILNRYHLPDLRTSLIWIHTPKKEDDALSARKRFAFEEIFFIQLEKQKEKLEWKKQSAYVVEPNEEIITEFTKKFPFPLTNAQNKSIAHILFDFKAGHPMSRLLEGDVGSGKTAVAATSVYAITLARPKGQDFGNLQTAYMVPTEILAQQHFESFISYFKDFPIPIGLITGSGCRKFPSKVSPSGWTNISRAQLLKWVANGEIPVLIGTHALIQKSVRFKHLAYIIIDEQHRFGTAQRQKLAKKEATAPHLLSMTATPIPRTLALTIYGDLDLSLLDEMPVGRKSIITEIVLPHNRESVYEQIRSELNAGRQAYVICPRINEPDPTKELAVLAKSVKEEAKRIKKDIFPEFKVGILHSKMTPTEKEGVMNDFKDGKIKILVATSVVEVGVNVPNATIIIIEGAERFGLAQLHQLRGRVIRSNHQPYCFVFAESKTKKAVERLQALQKSLNGFQLAEYDLAQRGAGELYGRKQWGITDLGMEAIKNLKMVEAARLEARNIMKSNPSLSKFPILKERLERADKKLHLE